MERARGQGAPNSGLLLPLVLVLVTFLIPVSAILLGVLVLGERLDPRHALGMALIGCGLAAIDGRLGALGRRRRSPPPETGQGRDIGSV